MYLMVGRLVLVVSGVLSIALPESTPSSWRVVGTTSAGDTGLNGILLILGLAKLGDVDLNADRSGIRVLDRRSSSSNFIGILLEIRLALNPGVAVEAIESKELRAMLVSSVSSKDQVDERSISLLR